MNMTWARSRHIGTKADKGEAEMHENENLKKMTKFELLWATDVAVAQI